MMLLTVKLEEVSIMDTAHAKVKLRFIDRTTIWHHFKSRKAWSNFYKYWKEYNKDDVVKFNAKTRRFFFKKKVSQ